MIEPSFLFYVLLLLATGVVVGFACGLLGIGGGFLMVPVQIWLLTLQGIEPTLATRIAFGTSLAVVLPTALSGCSGHSCRGVVLWRPGIIIGLCGMLGGFLGGTIATHAPGDLLRMAFGFVIMMAALRMLFAPSLLPRLTSDEKSRESLLQYIFWGLAVGVISGLIGIGGGVILVPAMVVAMGFSMYQAIGTSSVAIALNAVGGVLAYIINGWGVAGLPAYCVGYIDLLQFVLLAGASIFTAQWGVKAAHRLPAEKLKYIFVMLMIYIGLKMIGVLEWVGL
ncbi:MAG: sulfite exporter TauE/SafE family protein [Methanotrichaceae archaeon]|nr:sulfite exporter TauE/SafE family protein [Methanotrichaceae archaeon]